MRGTRIGVLAALLVSVFYLPNGNAQTSDRECLSIQTSTPFFEVSASRSRLFRNAQRNHNKGDDLDHGETGFKWETSTALQQDLDHTLVFDSDVYGEASRVIDSGATWIKDSSSSPCITVSVAVYDVSIGLGRFLYGTCEPVIESSGNVDFRTRRDYSPNVTVPELKVHIHSAIGLDCGLWYGPWVAGYLNGDLTLGVTTDTYDDEIQRYLDLDVYANAEAGFVANSVYWSWTSPSYTNRILGEIESY